MIGRYREMLFSIEDFRASLSKGFLNPLNLGYDFVDPSKFENLFDTFGRESKHIKSLSVFDELSQRMSKKYFQAVFLAQLRALHFASRRFPAYSIIMPEDLAEDWLATVDFHKKFSRDHSLHQPLTAYVVAKLLGYGDERRSFRVPAGCGNLLGLCTDSIILRNQYLQHYALAEGLPESLFHNQVLARCFWKDMFYKTAIMSALFHDIGYPWQYVGRINDSLKMCSPLLHPNDSISSFILKEMGDRLSFLPFHKYLYGPQVMAIGERQETEQLIKLALDTHGLPGAIAFLSLHDAIKASHSLSPLSHIQSFSIEWAALGILMHDMVHIQQKNVLHSLRIDFQKDPLSSIVSMADFIEEFNRPNVSFSSFYKWSQASFGNACSNVKVEISADAVFQVKMRYNSEGAAALAGRSKAKETEEYFNLSSGFIDLSSIGVRDFSFIYETL